MTKIDLLEQDGLVSEKAQYRTVPHNNLAEQMLLGAFLTNNEHVNKVTDFLSPEHFYEPVHSRIFDSILKFLDKGVIATPVTLKNLFDKDPSLSDSGGASYLAKLASLSSAIINISDYGRIIYDLALRRKLINVGEEIVNDAFDKEIEVTATEQIEKAEQSLYVLSNEGQSGSSGFMPLQHSVIEAINRAEKAFKNREKVTGISTGFIDMDEMLGGLQDSDLLILAGRPSMGKTALAINLALNSCKFLDKKKIAKNEKKPSVGLFSLEMSSEQIAMRMLAMESKVNSSKIRKGMISDDEFSKIMISSQTLDKIPFFIDDTPALSIASLRTRARRLKRKHNMSLLVIDYLQLIKGSLKASEGNRVQEISEITQGLKAIAKELNIPVIALSQLSRAVEQREDKRPLLSDLRESGSIEQDADIVMFIFREEYYLIRKQPTPDTDAHTKWQESLDQVQNLTEVIIAKHRNGPVGTVRLYFDSDTTQFANYSKTGMLVDY